jgi:uncharacterized membrane protein required for colicin V production
MIGLNALFWVFIIIFAMIGMMRGWAKEMLVTFSVIVALFIISVLETYVPFIRDNLSKNPTALFWMETIIMLVMVFFGYQTPNIPRLAASGRFARDRLQDGLLGLFMGAVNGYLIYGSLWYWLVAANYPVSFVLPPPPGPMTEATMSMMPLMPPYWLGVPLIYFVVALAFIFVLVVFI